jgi:hypothetical protein
MRQSINLMTGICNWRAGPVEAENKKFSARLLPPRTVEVGFARSNRAPLARDVTV